MADNIFELMKDTSSSGNHKRITFEGQKENIYVVREIIDEFKYFVAHCDYIDINSVNKTIKFGIDKNDVPCFEIETHIGKGKELFVFDNIDDAVEHIDGFFIKEHKSEFIFECFNYAHTTEYLDDDQKERDNSHVYNSLIYEVIMDDYHGTQDGKDGFSIDVVFLRVINLYSNYYTGCCTEMEQPWDI